MEHEGVGTVRTSFSARWIKGGAAHRGPVAALHEHVAGRTAYSPNNPSACTVYQARINESKFCYRRDMHAPDFVD